MAATKASASVTKVATNRTVKSKKRGAARGASTKAVVSANQPAASAKKRKSNCGK